MKRFAAGAALLATLTLSGSAMAEPRTTAPAPEAPHAAQGVPGPCADGVVKDDGSAETGWGWVPSVIWGQYVQEFHRSEFPSDSLSSICICFLRTGTDDDIDFEVVFYSDVDGRPSFEPFAVVPAQGFDIPAGVPNATFIEVPLPGVDLPQGTFYIGPRWNPSVDRSYFVCADTTPSTPRTDAWFLDDRAEEWDSVLTTEDPLFQNHRALLVRPVVGGPAIDVPILPTGGLAILAIAMAGAGFWLLWRR